MFLDFHFWIFGFAGVLCEKGMVKNHATRIFRDIVAYLTIFGKLPFTKVKMILIIGIMYIFGFLRI